MEMKDQDDDNGCEAYPWIRINKKPPNFSDGFLPTFCTKRDRCEKNNAKDKAYM